MGKKNEIEIYEDKLPSDKKGLRTELLKYKKEEKERKVREKNKQKIEIVLLLVLIGVVFVTALLLSTGLSPTIKEEVSNDNPPLVQYENRNDAFYKEQYKSASDVYGQNPIRIDKRITKNGITTNIKQVVFKPDRTILAVEVVNHNDQAVHLMLPQQSYLKDNYGRRYQIDPFESESNLNSTLPAKSRDYTNLVFEKTNEDAKSMTYSATIGGLMGTPAWEQSISFEI